MKVCMLAYTFYDSDNRVRRYAEALVKRGDTVDAIALAREGQPAYEVIKGVHVFRIQKRTIDESGPFSYLIKLLVFLFRSAWVLTLKHLREPYQLIHVHSVPDFEVFAALIPRLLGARVILDIHDIVPELYAGKFKVRQDSRVVRMLLAMERLSIAFSNHVIIANQLWYDRITKRSVHPKKCTNIINYPDLSLFHRRPRPARNSEDFIMYYPGSLNWHQGLDIAIEAVALLRDTAPNLMFYIFGDGPARKQIRTRVRELKLRDRVFLKGFVPLEQVAEFMATADLGVEPKRKDSFGNEAMSTKIMEFMAMNVPVVASRTLIHEYYFNDDQVEFFESGSAKDLAHKILDLMAHPARRASLREQGTKVVANNSWEKRQYEYLDLVDRLVGTTKSAKSAPHRDVAKSANLQRG